VHLALTVLDGDLWLQEGDIWGRTPSQNMQLQIAAKLSVLCCHAPGEYKGNDSAYGQITFVLVFLTYM